MSKITLWRVIHENTSHRGWSYSAASRDCGHFPGRFQSLLWPKKVKSFLELHNKYSVTVYACVYSAAATSLKIDRASYFMHTLFMCFAIQISNLILIFSFSLSPFLSLSSCKIEYVSNEVSGCALCTCMYGISAWLHRQIFTDNTYAYVSKHIHLRVVVSVRSHDFNRIK